ncbi:MAG: transcription-repair coupling factor [Limisphaerales bacterium]
MTANSSVFDRISQLPAAQALARRLEAGGLLSCATVSRAAQAFLAVWLRAGWSERPVVLVTDTLKIQETVFQDVATWMGMGRSNSRNQAPLPHLPPPLFYPAWDILPHEARLPHVDVISERLETLLTLTANATRITPLIVTNVVALLQRTFPAAELARRTRQLKRGDRLAPLDLVEWLEEQGYEPEAKVESKGQLALRGGILDVFPPTSPWPVRLEFFGDELESLREFDPLTQISRETTETATLPPAGELGLLKRGTGSVECESEASTPLASLLDHLPANTIFLLSEPLELEEQAALYASQVPAGDRFFVPWAAFRDEAVRRGMSWVELSEADAAWDGDDMSALHLPGDLSPDMARQAGPTESGNPSPPFKLHLPSLDAFRPLVERAPEPPVAEAQRREFFHQLHRWLRQGFAVHVFCNNEGERQRFTEIWSELGLEADASGADHASHITQIGTLSRGFLSDEAKLVVVTDAEIFGRYKRQQPRRLKSAHAQAARSALDIDFTELEAGDLVVHLHYGIGKFLGLQAPPETSGDRKSEIEPRKSEECLVIEYAPADPLQPAPKLYVPVTEAHLVGKYVGVGKVRPPLNTLTGTRWRKAKEQAERAVRDVAAELLQIQAVRESQAGHAFGPDTPWQREFEGAFLYEETPDQWRAIQETKADMERPKPMDRLICGDVGFGKTEVAIRAAFKAVMGGKQVAVLVPTTVLAQQHFNTLRERMADYPVRIELLSRFRSRREQARVLGELARGAVDIVVGTHRLVQPDVVFKDLGLVVIDEEQRFGVLHKERFKRLRTLVDVLTLSATPIPRTLYLALTGARDMSTIQTPPQDRLPVETIVTGYDERVIRDAIQRELNRGGQVFFLHNRVSTIEVMAQRLRALVPQARIVVGHGQMHSDDLEEVMTTFVNGEADVLLSTTIIESGLDIPNANTIIIDRADRFGLSELYQLRGRVGRYKHQAYAYLLIPRHAGLLSDARKRIAAMKQYSTLGAGFKIAMRDLEIRGAGNLLGAEQSGHITAVGFELYCQLLQQSIATLKGEKVKPRVEVAVRLDFLNVGGEEDMMSDAGSVNLTPHASPITAHATLPHAYITEPRQRIEIYRKLALARDRAELAALQQEVRDRFGPLPPAAELLFLLGDLKLMAAERGVTSIEVEGDKLKLKRAGDFIQVGGKFPRLTKQSPEAKLKEIRRLLTAL